MSETTHNQTQIKTHSGMSQSHINKDLCWKFENGSVYTIYTAILGEQVYMYLVTGGTHAPQEMKAHVDTVLLPTWENTSAFSDRRYTCTSRNENNK